MDIEQIMSQYENIEKKRREDSEWMSYTATKKETGTQVFLKELPVGKKELYERLINQKHCNVCEVYRIYETQRNGKEGIEKFLVAETEFIQGKTLREHVEEKGVLDIKETVMIALQICDGLDFLHSHQIIHKDLSPDNIMVTENEIVKIIDLGYSKVLDKTKKCDSTIVYSWGCTAAEVTTGNKVGAPADIFSFGRIVNFMLTGETYEIKYKPKFKLNQIRLARIIRKCTKEKAKERYQNIKKVRSKLKKVNPENNTITKRNANIKLAIGMSVAFLIGLSIFSVFCYVPEPDNSDKYAELGQISQQWSDIYYYMDVTKDYDSALKKLDEIMEDTGAENVYLYYAKCLVGKGEYDNAAESLITYIKKIYKYPNMTSKTKDSYVFLQSLENQVSKEELEKIIKVKKEAEKYIDKWEQASDKLKNQDYDGAIEIIDELIDEGAKIDVAYFMKIECLLGKGEKSKAQAVYKEYMEKKDKLEGYEIVDYSTADYNYLEEIYEKIK